MLGIFADTKPVCTSPMYFKIDLNELDSSYDGAYEGQNLYVMMCIEGQMVCVQATVEDGCIYLVLDKLGMDEADFGYTQFVIVDEATFTQLVQDGSVSTDSLMDSVGNEVAFAA